MRALALLLLAASAFAGELSNAEREVIRAASRVRPSVVTVVTPNKRDFNLTGVVVSTRGAILTLRKPLLQDGRLPAKVRVRFPGKDKWVDAEVIDDDGVSDTVLLEVSKMTTRPVLLRKASDARLGQWVLLAGNTFGAGQEGTPTVSLGVVSGLVKDGEKVLAIHASTLVNPGSFGAPVVDTGGGLIGITAYKVTDAGGQSVVIPFEFIRERYRAKKGRGSFIFASPPRKRRKSSRITDMFGLVMEDAAKRAEKAVVGVRSAKLGTDQPVPSVITLKGGRKVWNPKVPPVKGALAGWDRSSGLVVSKKGWIVCPLRVTGWPGPSRALTVDLWDGRSFPAKVLGHDERLRIALLAIDARDLEPLEPIGQRALRAGQFLMAVGFPHESPSQQSPQVTCGILSRAKALNGLFPLFEAIQTDAGVAGGNRGGALVDIDGRVVGMLLDVHDTNPRGYQTRQRGAYFGNAGLGFALPMHVLDRIVPRLAKGGVLKRGYLGVAAVPVAGGLRVETVSEKNSKQGPTTAAKAGLKPGDILLRIGQVTLKTRADLQRALALHAVGEKIEIAFRRAGKQQTVEVELGER